jgi:hypothetical protein
MKLTFPAFRGLSLKGGEFYGVTNSKRKPDADAPMPALLPGMDVVDIDRSGFPAPISYDKLFSRLIQRCSPELLSTEEIEVIKKLISKNIKECTLSTREIPTGLVSLLIVGSVAFGAREVRLLLWVILFWEAVHHLSKALCRPGTSSSI